jgi:hypothetical protein
LTAAIRDQALEAFRRLLADASAGGQTKVDALVALSQRTVWVATWTSLGDDYRTLVNSNGLSALPVFTGVDCLEDAARRFGWVSGDGSVPSREVGAREILRHAIAHNLEYVVVDITSDHSLEMEKQEIEPLLTSQAKRDSAGPFAAVGKISSDVFKAVNASSHPPPPTTTGGSVPVPVVAVPVTAKAPTPPSVPPAARAQNFSTKNSRVSVPPQAPMSDKTAAGTHVQVSALQSEPADALVEELTSALRNYLEIEWAALCLVSHGPAGPVPSVGIRVDGAVRQRVPEITRQIRAIGEKHGAPLGTLVLDDAGVMRTIRSDGYLFYPWKKR